MASIHHPMERLQISLRGLDKDSQISEQNKQLIKRFKDNCLANGLSPIMVVKYVYNLTKIARRLKKRFDRVTKEDVEKLVAAIETDAEFSKWTAHARKVAIKKFYKWLSNGKYPKEVEWIKTTFPKNNSKLPEELLTVDEIKEMSNSTTNPRDKALIMCLYESGCRVGEFLGLKIKHLEKNDYGVKITVHGKTGSRRILLVNSVPILLNWLQFHPEKENPEAWLWCGIGHNNYKKQLSYAATKKVLKNSAKKAGIKKRIYPHLFRHSRATELANHLTEAQMCQYFGWVQGSDQPATYVHLSGRDTDEAVLKANGVKIKPTEKGKVLKTCPRCQSVNTSRDKFCKSCGMALDLKTIVEIEEKRRAYDEIVSALLKTNEGQKLARKLIYEGRLDKEFRRLGE